MWAIAYSGVIYLWMHLCMAYLSQCYFRKKIINSLAPWSFDINDLSANFSDSWWGNSCDIISD